MKRNCPICNKSQLNLSNHLSKVHKIDGDARKKWLTEERQRRSGETPDTLDGASGVISIFPINNSFVGAKKDCGDFKMLHPFTCMTVGMSGVGKTYWVMKLLEHAQQSIQPPPERVVWSYSHWQSAYTRLQQILPWIEFVRGIPVDMEQDWYFDPKVNNLFVIDDQMQESSNKDQILNLFTRGSNHRNLIYT